MIATITQDQKSKRHTYLAANLRRWADSLDAFADDAEAWGLSCDDYGQLLGLIRRGDVLRRDGQRLLDSPEIGDRTKAQHGNDFYIALGGYGHEGGFAYNLAYATKQMQQYGARSDGRSRLDVPAQSCRCAASSARVVAQIADEVAAGKYGRIG